MVVVRRGGHPDGQVGLPEEGKELLAAPQLDKLDIHLFKRWNLRRQLRNSVPLRGRQSLLLPTPSNLTARVTEIMG